MPEPVSLTIGTAFAAYVTYKEVLPRFVKIRVNVTPEGQPRTLTGAAGQQTTEFWLMKFDEIVGKAIEQRIIPIMERQTEIMETMSKTLDRLATIEDYRRGRMSGC